MRILCRSLTPHAITAYTRECLEKHSVELQMILSQTTCFDLFTQLPLRLHFTVTISFSFLSPLFIAMLNFGVLFAFCFQRCKVARLQNSTQQQCSNKSIAFWVQLWNEVLNTKSKTRTGHVERLLDWCCCGSWLLSWDETIPEGQCRLRMVWKLILGFKRFPVFQHFPGMFEICRKDLLARNLNRMLKLFPNDYNIFPKTWCFPAE